MLWDVEAGYEAALGPGVHTLQGKRVVIAGEGGGVGRTTAALLAGYGARVLFSAHSAEDLGATLSAIAAARGEGEGMVVNLRDPQGVKTFLRRAARLFGQVDMLVDLLQLEADGSGASEQFLPPVIRGMCENKQGRIISVGMQPAGRAQLAGLRRKLKGSGIRITRIEPGLSGFAGYPGALPVSANDIARCVYESLVQPFSVDLVFLKDQAPGKLL